MAVLAVQFSKAKSNVEPERSDKENAADAHANVRGVLEEDATLNEYGIDTVLIGSYKRQVSIRRVKDVDVLSKLPELPADADVDELMAHLIGVLQQAYDEPGQAIRVHAQDSSVKVDFPAYDMHVDVVPARLSGDYIEIPDRTGGWLETNPEELTLLSSKMNDRYDGDYVPIVKLVRQARRAHLGKRPGGLFFEILTYHAFDDGLDASSAAALFTGALRSIAAQLEDAASGTTVDDPTRPGEHISVRVSDAQMQEAADTFSKLANEAEQALDADTCPAAAAYRSILGAADGGQIVFEMPATCDDEGVLRFVPPIVAGDRHVPAGDSRFA